MEGNTQWEFNNNVLKSSFGISIDGDGNAYVVGEGTNNVVISPNGQNYRELLTSKNGLENPAAIHVDRSNNKMLVANTEGTAFVFNLK